MILHVLDDEKFLNKAIKLFEDIFPGENMFLVGVPPETERGAFSKPIDSDNVIYASVNSSTYYRIFEKQLAKADLLFFHNLYKDYKLRLEKFIPSNIKTAWYFWGAELYGINVKVENLMPLTKAAYYKSLPLSVHFRKRILANLKKRYNWYLFKKILKNKVDYVLTNIAEDFTLLNQYAKSDLKLGWFTYFSFQDDLETTFVKEKRHILIGNSSSETNNHFDAFASLSDKDLKEKKIYIPLNYGDSRYRDIVIKRATSLFGARAIPIVDFLTLKEYNAIIDSCAVLIMNHKRQQAFNTIMLAIAVGCKVFLREENTIYMHLKREGFQICSLQSDFERPDAFDALSIENQQFNINLAKELYAYPVVKQKIKAEILTIRSERS